MAEDKSLIYTPVELFVDGLQAIYYNNETEHKLVVKLDRKFTKPGTYRLRISWSYEGLCYDTTEIPFFVNCSEREETVKSGLEVSDDE